MEVDRTERLLRTRASFLCHASPTNRHAQRRDTLRTVAGIPNPTCGLSNRIIISLTLWARRVLTALVFFLLLLARTIHTLKRSALLFSGVAQEKERKNGGKTARARKIRFESERNSKRAFEVKTRE